jgi:amino acid transporter
MPAARKHPPRALLLWPLVMALFFDVSGGPFGLESLMQSGPGMAVLLLLITPIIWAAPAALLTAELASALPQEGGYYVWVRRSMGPFWSFVCGWWTWVYSWVDAAIYPTLFAGYVSSLIVFMGRGSLVTADHPWIQWAVGMVVIVPFTWLNVRGVKIVGKTAILFAALVIAPFILIFALGLPQFLAHPAAAIHPFVPPGQSTASAFDKGLFVVMWNYLGWDSLSTVAEEVENPQKTYPKALAICMPLVIIVYLLPTLVGLVAYPDYKSWDDGSWTTVAQHIAGPWLAITVNAIGLISAAGLFMATLLGASRIPFVLAEDGFLPKRITRLHPRYGTPWVAILISAIFYTILSFKSFSDLAELDVVVYSAAILIEFAALLMLRYREPDLPRPFKIPGGWPVVILVALLPVGMVSFAVYNQFATADSLGDAMKTFWMSAVALATGPIAYFISKLVRNRNAPTPQP